jgi:hypothetical protein
MGRSQESLVTGACAHEWVTQPYDESTEDPPFLLVRFAAAQVQYWLRNVHLRFLPAS